MKTPCGIELRAGQRWKELDKRYFERIVSVVDWDEPKGTVRIMRAGRITRANVKRFSAKSGGYEFVLEGPDGG
jgi:hypothetical protein